MIATSHVARVSLFGLLLVLAACGSKREDIKITPPGPRPGNSCEAFAGVEQRQAVAALAKLFHSRTNASAIALGALALMEKVPAECLEYVEQQINEEHGK